MDHRALAGSASSDLTGRVLGGSYRILRRIDEGGMGTIYAAEHLRLARHVAIKILARHLCDSEKALRRFRREAALISSLDDPHIVSVLDFDVTEEGYPYLVMELLHGQTLATHMERQGTMAVDEALEVAVQIAGGLAATHAAGIIHRDLKPANVFLVNSHDAPFVKLMDFGISKRTSSSQKLTLRYELISTPQYMAPEQASGRVDAVGPATDQFALAVIVYEMLTGEHPFEAESLTQTLVRVLSAQPRPASEVAPGVPPAIDAVLSRALCKDETGRFGAIRQFADALLAAAGYERRRASLEPRRVRAHGLANADQSVTLASGEVGTTARPAVPELLERIDAARAAFLADDVIGAARHAQHAVRVAWACDDPVAKRVMRVSERLLEMILVARLGAENQALSRRTESTPELALCPKEAFLLSRLEGDGCVEDVLDVAAMPRIEALATLASLLEKGAICVASRATH